jgi:hypothetical protein
MPFVVEANSPLQETDLIDAAAAWLSDHLPPTWSTERRDQTFAGGDDAEPQRVDATIDVRAPNGTYTTFAVEAKRSFLPRDVERLLPSLTRLLRTLAGNVPLLVVAPWLSARTRELLERERINYLDLTGNALIRLDNPAVYVKTAGAARNPEPEPRSPASVRGPKAARLIRLLADVRPPYGVRELGNAASLAPGYVSRLLDSLDRDALVERSRKGEVESVDVPGLLRRWTESYDVLKTNEARRFIAPAGAGQAMDHLAATPNAGRTAVTGSFAAVRRAPVAAPALLLAYTNDVDTTAAALDLLPADEGANVVLLRPFDRVVWDRTAQKDGITYAALSQVAADCLTGTGRMPAEGEALLRWMTENDSEWRLGSLGEAQSSGEVT